MELKEYKEEIGISTLILVIFYISIVVYKKFNPFDFPDIERRILYFLIPLCLVSVLFWFKFSWSILPIKRIIGIFLSFSRKLNDASNKIESKLRENKGNLRKEIKKHKKGIILFRDSLLRFSLVIFVYIFRTLKRVLNLIIKICKKVLRFISEDWNNKSSLILSLLLLSISLILFFMKGFEIIIIFAFIFSCLELYYALVNMKSHKA